MNAGPSTVRRRPPIALLFGITVTGILSNTLVGPAIPDILDEFDRAESAAGFLVAAGSVPGIVVAPLIGVLADRHGRRRVVVPCLVAFGIGGLLAAAAPTYPLLVAARLFQGFGSAGLINLAVVLIGDHWEGTDRTRLIGRNAAVLTLSLAVVPPLGGALTDLVGWRWAFTVYSVALLTAVACWVLLPEDRPDEPTTIGAQLRGAREGLRQPVILASLGSGVVVFVLIFGGFLTAFPVHLEQQFDLGATSIGLMLAVPAASSSVVAFNLGRLRDALGIRRLLIFAGFTYVAAFAGVAASPVIGLVVGATVLYGLGEGVFIPSLQDVVAETADPAHRGATIAIWVGAVRFGQSIGPLLVAGALTVTTTTGVFAIGAVIALGLLAAQLLGPIGRDEPSQETTPSGAPA